MSREIGVARKSRASAAAQFLREQSRSLRSFRIAAGLFMARSGCFP
jgi:hypothetical protein